MLTAVMLAFQATAPLVDPGAAAFDLRAVTAKCGADGDEIVICGAKPENEKYRLRALPEKYGDKPLRAETGIIGNVRGDLGVSQVEMPQGQVSKRVMVTIKVPF